MPSMHDLAQLDATIATKRAELGVLFEEAEVAPVARRDRLTSAIKSSNTELSKLVDQRESLYNAVKADRLSRQPVDRQIDPRDFNPSGHDSSPEQPGSVRALKSADKFSEHYGGTTSVSLDAYLRAAFSGN